MGHVVASAVGSQGAAAKRAMPAPPAEATELHRSAIVIDSVVNAAFGRAFFEDMRQGGYTAAIITLAMPFYSPDRVWQTLHEVAEWQKWFTSNSDLIMSVRRASDIAEAKRRGLVGIIFGMQDGGPYSGDLELLRVYRELGLRVSSLCYNQRNLLAEGCTEPSNAGLSRLGHRAIEMLNELNILLDLSHMGYRSAFEAVEISKRPVALTHSNALNLCDNPRNVPDELLEAVAKSGGVIGVSPLPMLLSVKRENPNRNIELLLDHIDYVVRLVGIDHVGFGSDFYKFTFQDAVAHNVAGTFLGRLNREPVKSEEDIDPDTLELLHPEGIGGVTEVPNVTAGLMRRGYAPDAIRKILGINFSRLFAATWGD